MQKIKRKDVQYLFCSSYYDYLRKGHVLWNDKKYWIEEIEYDSQIFRLYDLPSEVWKTEDESKKLFEDYVSTGSSYVNGCRIFGGRPRIKYDPMNFYNSKYFHMPRDYSKYPVVAEYELLDDEKFFYGQKNELTVSSNSDGSFIFSLGSVDYKIDDGKEIVLDSARCKALAEWMLKVLDDEADT